MGERVVRWAALVVLAVGGCGAPRDPEGSTDRIVSTRVLRVGATQSPPWVQINAGEPTGPEADLIRRFAGSLGARVGWIPGGQQQLLQALEDRRLDLVAAGADASTPWKARLGVSLPYATSLGPHGLEKRVLLTAPGENQLLMRLDRFVLATKKDPAR